MNDELFKKLNEKDKKRLIEALKDYEEMMKEISPFIKPVQKKSHSTRGKWRSHSY